MIMASTQLWNSQMTPEDKQLYKELGQRIAQTRKALGLTQTQVAEQLGISQQTLAHYEVGRLRIAVSTLVPLAEILHSSVDELLHGKEATKGSNKRGPASKLQQQIEQVRLLPRAKQQFVMEMLDTVIQQSAH
ncbi:helix-turn-helix transcriptional regulator [Vibrio parahaemolyticus]|nr:helix-turn-helix transcriptional regulator [Vibrio parahaemolyticus]MBE4211387.1 helix-turn-helix transcriptional regulator [Vibrio parahaemolyticus]MBE4242707.1 helix-turn-helix transcriptional regulator [Vibrio parahaemolyticus]TOA67953.1 transcriptional regulator [Vibrio parahaemolyticus]